MSKDKNSSTNVKIDISRYELRHWKFAIEEAFARSGFSWFANMTAFAEKVSEIVGHSVARTTIYTYWEKGYMPEDVQRAIIGLLKDFLPILDPVEEAEVA